MTASDRSTEDKQGQGNQEEKGIKRKGSFFFFPQGEREHSGNEVKDRLLNSWFWF